MIDRFERFSIAITEIYRCWHKIASDEMEEYGLKGAYAVYFTALSRYPDGMTAIQLGKLCSRDKADVSRAIAALEQKHLVKRIANGHRIYRTVIALTEKGYRLAEEVNRKAKIAVACAGRGLSEENRAGLYEALEMISANLQTLSRHGLPSSDTLPDEPCLPSQV